MPELPEVETIRRSLHTEMVGRSFVGLKVLWERSITPADAAAFANRLVGQTVARVERRGKWLMMGLRSGDSLLIHLRMSGRLILGPGQPFDCRHLRVLFTLDDGQQLSFLDQRKFGRLCLTDDPTEVLGPLGPDPLSDEFTVGRFAEMLSHRRARIKPLLLNQRFLAGLGNIYVDESLWHARIHPLRRADALTPVETSRLHQRIRSVLRAAIARGGTTLPDAAYRKTDGQEGEFAPDLCVYGREGEPCPRCGGPIARIRAAQRGTHYCLLCQQLGG